MKTKISFIILCAFSMNMMAQTSIVIKSGNEETLMLLNDEPTMTIGETIKVTDGTTTKEYGTDKRVTLFVKNEISLEITDANDVKTSQKLVSGDNLVLNDNIKAIVVHERVENVNLSYTRNFSNAMVGNWQAWFVPFDIDYSAMSSNYDVAEIAGIILDNNGENLIAFKKVKEGTIKRNTYYVVRVKSAGDKTVKATTTLWPTIFSPHIVQSSYNNFSFKGVYENTYYTSENSAYVLNEKGVFAKISSGSISPFRICLKITDREDSPYTVDSAPEEVKIMVLGEDDPTGVNNVDADVNVDEIYNLAGQKLQKPQKGINIINGKKVLF